MEIEHAQINGIKTVIQLIRSNCPLCRHPVEFVIPKKDRLYQRDAEYYKERCSNAHQEICKLHKIIDKLLEKGT